MQMQLPILTYYEGPTLVDPNSLVAIKTYRQAVQTCWLLRKRRSMKLSTLAEEAGLYASHLSDYLSDDATKRELPAKHIAAFETACGNRAITQWISAQANLTILETFVARRAA